MSWFDRNRHLYPDDWPEIATRIKASAGWKCLACSRPHGPSPAVLTVHHLDHDPSNCADDNLLACCQSCHLKCQSFVPRPTTIGEAIRRLQEWIRSRDSQLRMAI
jgi:hypothetical protein